MANFLSCRLVALSFTFGALTSLLCHLTTLMENDFMLEKLGEWEKTFTLAFVDHHDDEFAQSDRLAEKLRQNYRIFCIIATTSSAHNNSATAVNQTWVRRCDGHVFISDEEDAFLPSLPFFDYNSDEFYEPTWKGIRLAFEWLYQTGRVDKFDFFLKANDETFVILENLRYYLFENQFRADDIVYLGRHMAPKSDEWRQKVKKHIYPESYASGMAGYVLSRGAVRKLNQVAFKKRYRKICPKEDDSSGLAEDQQMGRCLELIGAKLEYSLDSYERQRFSVMQPFGYLFATERPDYEPSFAEDRYPQFEAYEAVSEWAISFGSIWDHRDVNALEYFIYRTRTIGRRRRRPQNYTGTNGTQSESYQAVEALLTKNGYHILQQ